MLLALIEAGLCISGVGLGVNKNKSIIIISDHIYGVVCCVVVSGNVRT